MVSHHCTFSREFSNYLYVRISCHIESSWMVSHLCVCHLMSELADWISCHTENSCKVFHKCVCSGGFSNYMLAWISCHIERSWMVSHLCVSFHALSNDLLWLSELIMSNTEESSISNLIGPCPCQIPTLSDSMPCVRPPSGGWCRLQPRWSFSPFCFIWFRDIASLQSSRAAVWYVIQYLVRA